VDQPSASRPARKWRLRDYAPKGLYWRSLLIIVLPVAVMQIILTYVFLDDHWRATSKRMSFSIAADVRLLIEMYEANPTPANFTAVQKMAKDPLQLDIAIDASGPLTRERCFFWATVIDRYMVTELREGLNRDVFYDASCPGPLVEIRLPIDQGVLVVKTNRDRVQAWSGPWFVAWMIGATVLLTTISIVFIRNQVRPIINLANAMERFGHGLSYRDFHPHGAREVRAAAASFQAMADRLTRFVAQRGQLLAGVSHDLRTPITRLRLQFAMMPDSPELKAARADLADMEKTIDEYLAFVGAGGAEAPSPIDITTLVREAAESAVRGGVKLELALEQSLSAQARPHALKRCLINLIDNAAAHGERVRVSAKGVNDGVEIMVEDDGPGIPPELYEDAFRPFSRLDETRTRNSKGVGLGLSIAREVAREHGGDVILGPSPLGGLRASLNLPASPAATPPV
jgi:two-component system, OmpR family, osmolarity sensor histidine kinase EnvZ